MDAERLLQAFSQDELQAVAAAMPADVLRAEIMQNRGSEFLSSLGATAIPPSGADQVVEAYEVTEPAPAPEITADTKDRLEALSTTPYGELVATRFIEAGSLISGLPTRIDGLHTELAGEAESGKIEELQEQITHLTAVTEKVPMPDLNELIGKIEELALDYEAYAEKGWTPGAEFIPRGLNQDEWSALLTGHNLPNGKSQGIYSSLTGYEVSDPYPPSSEDAWGLTVMADTLLTNVSKDGTHGSKAKKVVKELSELPSVTADTSYPEAVIAQASPGDEAYNAVQLGRMRRGEKPLDPQTWTISRRNVQVGGVLRSEFLAFSPDFRKVGSDWYDRGYASGDFGVRPSAER